VFFPNNYRKLYSSVPYDFNDLQRINKDINCWLSFEQMSSDYNYSCRPTDVKDVVSHLKTHKSDGNLGQSSDHIFNAIDLFFTNLALLFSSIVIHGKIPDSYLLSTVVPLPKGNNVNKSVSSQFRGKAQVSSVYGKIFDNIVLSRYSKMLASSELQFGFKANNSTNLCSMIVMESIAYYLQNTGSRRFLMIRRRLAHSSSVVIRLNLLIRSRIYRAFTYQRVY